MWAGAQGCEVAREWPSAASALQPDTKGLCMWQLQDSWLELGKGHQVGVLGMSSE